MKGKPRGFSHIVLLVALVVVMLIGSIGWVVYSHKQHATLSSSTQTALSPVSPYAGLAEKIQSDATAQLRIFGGSLSNQDMLKACYTDEVYNISEVNSDEAITKGENRYPVGKDPADLGHYPFEVVCKVQIRKKVLVNPTLVKNEFDLLDKVALNENFHETSAAAIDSSSYKVGYNITYTAKMNTGGMCSPAGYDDLIVNYYNSDRNTVEYELSCSHVVLSNIDARKITGKADPGMNLDCARYSSLILPGYTCNVPTELSKFDTSGGFDTTYQ